LDDHYSKRGSPALVKRRKNQQTYQHLSLVTRSDVQISKHMEEQLAVVAVTCCDDDMDDVA
jgi:hypothetical protein